MKSFVFGMCAGGWARGAVLLVAGAGFVAAAPGCQEGQRPAPRVADRMAEGRSADAAADDRSEAVDSEGAAGRDGPGSRPIALVNGEPIETRELVDLLLETRGLTLLQQLMLTEAVRQAAARRGISLTPADMHREYDLTLEGARFNGDQPEALTRARREMLIDRWVKQRGVSRQGLDIAMRRQAYLRKLAADQVKITDEMLEEAFRRVHGEKVEVRHLQFRAPRTWDLIREKLQQGRTFEEMVRAYSENSLSRANAGLLMIARDESAFPSALIEAAYQLKKGEMSNPIEVEGAYHVLKCERIVQPEQVTLEQVRDRLESNLRERIISEKMEAIGRRLLLESSIRIQHRMLREQYRKGIESGEIIGPPLRED